MDNNVVLKPLSWRILQYLYGKGSIRSEEVAEELGLKVRAVDAAITKSLVRWGFVIREYKLSKVLKREHSEIRITPRGIVYVEQRSAIEDQN